MRKVPTSMNNRKPAGSRDCEWQGSSAPFANSPTGTRTRTGPAHRAAPIGYSAPVLAGAALTADPDSKPPQA